MASSQVKEISEHSGESDTFDAQGALSRAFLLRRDYCCENGCRNCPYGFKKPALARTIMIQGTASHVGKSVLTAAICAWLRQQGFRVAPFKALNMALNSAVTSDGLEISRSVAFQAEVSGAEPVAQMNPILLKPTSERGSQVIALGKPLGYRSSGGREDFKEWALPIISESLTWLRERYEIVVMEGAGSAAEVNLRDTDVANMRAAALGDAPVLLVGDIDRGGVFAALYGTIALLPEEHRSRVKGIVVNKFRGDPGLFQSGVEAIEDLCQVPVLGVLPYLHNLAIPEEDAVSLETAQDSSASSHQADIVVVHLPHISNFTDFDMLQTDPDLNIRYVQRTADWGSPDLVILPGTKSTMSDLKWLREQGLAQLVVEHAHGGKRVLGLCGGYQMLGRRIQDPEAVESEAADVLGLGMLDVDTVFDQGKSVRQVAGIGVAGWLKGAAVSGYEIHHGVSVILEGAQSLLELSGSVTEVSRVDGAIDPTGQITGCYLHGLFDTPQVRSSLRTYLGLPASVEDESLNHCNRLANWLENNVDTSRLLRIILES